MKSATIQLAAKMPTMRKPRPLKLSLSVTMAAQKRPLKPKAPAIRPSTSMPPTVTATATEMQGDGEIVVEPAQRLREGPAIRASDGEGLGCNILCDENYRAGVAL